MGRAVRCTRLAAAARRPATQRHCARFATGGTVLALLAGLAGCGTSKSRGEIHFADGRERLALGDSVGALRLFQRANYELGGDPRLLVEIGRLQSAQGTLEARAQARAAFLAALDLDPLSATTHAALGELLREQRFLRASTGALTEAVRLDPKQSRPWLLLGHNTLEEYFTDMEVPQFLDSAQAYYERALQLDAANDEARYRLAFLAMHRHQHEAARALILTQAQRDCPGRFGFLLAAIDFHLKRFDEAQARVDATLACMSPQERESWIGLVPVLHPDSLGAYRMWQEARRDSLCRNYWWGHDPTPASLTNERLVEHICRAVEADLYFAVSRLGRPGRGTDRGEIYLRYGPPALARRIPEFKFPTWEWRYWTRGDDDLVIHFTDSFLNGDYVRWRRRAWSDFSEPEIREKSPTHTSLVFAAPPGGWKHVVRQFRGNQGRTALEIAYEFEELGGIEALNVEAAGWRGPGDLAQRSRASVQRSSLYSDGDRKLGRLRFELAPEPLTLGLELAGLQRLEHAPPDTTDRASAPVDGAASPEGVASPRFRIPWRAMGRDTLALVHYDASTLMMSDIMLAHEVRNGHGGMFDMGGVIAVPRVDRRIEQELLHLYFEVYPSERAVREQTAIAVRYEVRRLPPRSWTFWEQFQPDFHRKLDAEQQPVVQATFTFLPTSDLERQQLSIDLTALDPGPYDLVVELVDTATGASTSRHASFDYAARPGGATTAASP